MRSSRVRLACTAPLIALIGCGRPNATPAARPPSIFTDVSSSSGISFALSTGASGEHLLQESVIGGLAWIDHDGDGDYDLYALDGASSSTSRRTTNRLWRNDGGTFHDVTEAAGVGDAGHSYAAAVADYDGDGDEDLFVSNFGRSTLYSNDGDGTFVDVTEASRLVSTGFQSSAAWLDADGDRDLDLYVVRYLEYDPETARRCQEAGIAVYCHPRYFAGQTDLLWENLGDGTFREIGSRAGIAIAGLHAGKGLGVLAADFDGDGHTDVYVANDTTPNFLWRSRGDGTFEDVAMVAGVAVDANGRAQAGMGVDAADLDGDGGLDIVVTNFWHERNNLYSSQSGGVWSDVAQAAGLGPSYDKLGFGVELRDFDLDGLVDMIVANGHVDDSVETLSPESGALYRQCPDLYRGIGVRRFAPVSPDIAGPAFAERFVARGLASSDWDGDGDVDVAIATVDRGIILLRNGTDAPHRSVTVTLRGRTPNRSAHGATVAWTIGGQRRLHAYQSARSYCAAVDPRLVIGLGDAGVVDQVVVRWPSGQASVREKVPGGMRLVIEEP